jgi:hypothetical protein
MELKQFGPWAYIVGVVIALIAGFVMPADTTVVLALGVLGLIVGLLNVADKEVQMFLVASIAFIVAASGLSGVVSGLFAGLPVEDMGIGEGLVAALNYLVAFTAPAAAIVAILALYKISKD